MQNKKFSPETWLEESIPTSSLWGDMLDELTSFQIEKLTTNSYLPMDEWLDAQIKANGDASKSIVKIVSKFKPLINRETNKSLQNAIQLGYDVTSEALGKTIAPGSVKEPIEEIVKKNDEIFNIIVNQHIRVSNELPFYTKMESEYQRGGQFLPQGNVDDLYNAIEKTIDKRLPSMLGVTYKNGRTVSFKSYIEMRIRTDINNLAVDSMQEASKRLGIVFFICDYFGDCAPDHKDYQGKVYVLENWMSIIPSEEHPKYIALIKEKDIKTLEWVKGAPVWLGTRPNCRHTFTPISFEKASNSSKTLKKMGLKYNGSYDKEKYEAMEKQRYNERMIRAAKFKYETKINEMLNCDDLSIQKRLHQEGRKYLNVVRHYQKANRILIQNNPTLSRIYKRENPNRLAYDLGAGRIDQTLTKIKINVTMLMEKIEVPGNKDDNTMRQWYVDSSFICHDYIVRNKVMSLEEKSRLAYNVRNAFKYKTRIEQDNQELAKSLYKPKTIIGGKSQAERNKTFEEKIKNEIQEGHTLEEAYQSIIDKMIKTNDEVNKSKGVISHEEKLNK